LLSLVTEPNTRSVYSEIKRSSVSTIPPAQAVAMYTQVRYLSICRQVYSARRLSQTNSVYYRNIRTWNQN